jgi:hypothetical protein
MHIKCDRYHILHRMCTSIYHIAYNQPMFGYAPENKQTCPSTSTISCTPHSHFYIPISTQSYHNKKLLLYTTLVSAVAQSYLQTLPVRAEHTKPSERHAIVANNKRPAQLFAQPQVYGYHTIPLTSPSKCSSPCITYGSATSPSSSPSPHRAPTMLRINGHFVP